MSRLQELKDSFKRRLITAARAHLIGHVERSISGYEEAIDRRRKLVDLLSNRDELRTAVFPNVAKHFLTETCWSLTEEQQTGRLLALWAELEVQVSTGRPHEDPLGGETVQL